MEIYYSYEPFSYGGKYRLFEYFSKGKVNDMISKSDIYTRFKQHKKPRLIMVLNIFSQQLMCLQKWFGYIP